MWIKFTYINFRDGRRTSQPVAIEVANATKALNVATTIGNAGHVVDVKVVIKKPTDPMTICLNEKAQTVQNDHLVTDWDIKSFIWALKAGIQLNSNPTM
jgi:hypothetical protein